MNQDESRRRFPELYRVTTSPSKFALGSALPSILHLKHCWTEAMQLGHWKLMSGLVCRIVNFQSSKFGRVAPNITTQEIYVCYAFYHTGGRIYNAKYDMITASMYRMQAEKRSVLGMTGLCCSLLYLQRLVQKTGQRQLQRQADYSYCKAQSSEEVLHSWNQNRKASVFGFDYNRPTHSDKHSIIHSILTVIVQIIETQKW